MGKGMENAMRNIEETLSEVLRYVEKNITDKLTVEDIARQVYMSPAHLHCVFKDFYGIPLAEYVRRQKLKKSLDLLRETDEKISDIAYDVGFEHESSFIRSFKREFGMTPGEVRKRDAVHSQS